MKAIVEYTDEEYVKMSKKYKALYDAIVGLKREELFTYTKTRGYAKYHFKGTYTDKLVEALGGRHPDEEEIIMLVDSGYSHFGAGCTINKCAKTFSGYVYID
jgi:hypothetical protein